MHQVTSTCSRTFNLNRKLFCTSCKQRPDVAGALISFMNSTRSFILKFSGWFWFEGFFTCQLAFWWWLHPVSFCSRRSAGIFLRQFTAPRTMMWSFLTVQPFQVCTLAQHQRHPFRIDDQCILQFQMSCISGWNVLFSCPLSPLRCSHWLAFASLCRSRKNTGLRLDFKFVVLFN